MHCWQIFEGWKGAGREVMSAGYTKLLAILLTAAMWSSTTVIICCLKALKAEHKGFPAAYKC